MFSSRPSFYLRLSCFRCILWIALSDPNASLITQLQFEEGLPEAALNPLLASEERLAAWRRALTTLPRAPAQPLSPTAAAVAASGSAAGPSPQLLMAALLVLEGFVRPEWVKPHWRPWAVPAPAPAATGGHRGGGI